MASAKRLSCLSLCVVLALYAAGVGATGAPAAQTSPDAAFASELQAAQQAYAAGDYHRAAALYDRIVRANPVNPTYWRRLAASHYLAGEYRESIPAYTPRTFAQYLKGDDPAMDSIDGKNAVY
jgi:hypothetical protein